MTLIIDQEPKLLRLPKGYPFTLEDLTSYNSFVIVGANGSGKSRLGSWLETSGPQKDNIHRIAAQKSLVFPTDSSPIGLANAKQHFLWGDRPDSWDTHTYEANKVSQKIYKKYGGSIDESINAPLNDFRDLLTLLFSEHYACLQESEDEFISSQTQVSIKKAKIRQLQEIWEEILPHRKMFFHSSAIQLNLQNTSDEKYNAKSMSDGERVIFYLIGQVLCTAENAIIVIDEPEIHIHKAIQDKLWRLLEAKRNDCTFVYLTHDLDFAVSREGARKVFMKEYNGHGFDWEIIPDSEELPEAMLLQLIGSRKPVLFIEGEEGSKDAEIFKLTYPHYLIKPVGGCSNVILATKAFKRLEHLHQLQCHGIIDRDYLIDGQIKSNEKNGIHTLKVAEIENLFITPQLVTAVARQLLLREDEVLEKVKEFIISRFRSDIEEHSMNVAKHMITIHFGRFSSDRSDPESLNLQYRDYCLEFKPKEIYDLAKNQANTLIEKRDYIGILQVYNKKELLSSISHLFNTKGEGSTYLDKLREMIRRSLIDIKKELSEFLPVIN